MGLGGPWGMGQWGLWGLFRSHSERQAIPSGPADARDRSHPSHVVKETWARTQNPREVLLERTIMYPTRQINKKHPKLIVFDTIS